jgi:uncharacterized lipoprotein YajG
MSRKVNIFILSLTIKTQHTKMKKMFFALVAVVALASCANNTETTTTDSTAVDTTVVDTTCVAVDTTVAE